MGLTPIFRFKPGLHEQDVVPQCVLDLNSFLAFQYPPQLHQNNESNKTYLRSSLPPSHLNPRGPSTLASSRNPPQKRHRDSDSVLTPEEIKITSYDVPELLQAIRRKEYSCETVTRAFLRRATLAQKLVCSLLSLTLGLDFGI
jgi:hypothetical protein